MSRRDYVEEVKRDIRGQLWYIEKYCSREKDIKREARKTRRQYAKKHSNDQEIMDAFDEVCYELDIRI